MRNSLKILFFLLITFQCFGDGYFPSKIKEILANVESIYEVKITKIEKDNKTPLPDRAFKIKYHFTLIKVIQGKITKKRIAQYVLPPYVYKTPGGKELRVWIKIPGSGREITCKPGKKYLFYQFKNNFSSNKELLLIKRVDQIQKKKELLKLLKKS